MDAKTRMQRAGAGLKGQAGRIGWVLLWLIGVPLPVLLILFLLRGCN